MKLQHTSTITRYGGEYPSLSAFLMRPTPEVTDSESFLTRAEGSFLGDKNAFSATYKEEEGESATLTLSGNTVRFTRGKTQAIFTRGATTAFSYVSAIGALPATVYTEGLDVKEKDGKLLLTVSYFMHVSDMVQKTTMRWKLF